MYNLIPSRGNIQPRFNVCPTTIVDAVVSRGEQRELVPMRWGLVPAWWKKSAKETPATFNARAETVATKPMFRDAYKRHRCVIPMSGYYEWLPTPDGKQPFYFTAPDDSILSAAGIWDEWRDVETGRSLKSCAMIIRGANEFVGRIHPRMPVLLERHDVEPWLSGVAPIEAIASTADDKLRAWPVSRRVNSSRASDEDESLIVPLAA